jgi:hypothetical protein
MNWPLLLPQQRWLAAAPAHRVATGAAFDCVATAGFLLCSELKRAPTEGSSQRLGGVTERMGNLSLSLCDAAGLEGWKFCFCLGW